MDYPGTPLQRGSQGEAVRLVQERLEVQQTGVYGTTTQENVRAFQQRAGLVPDGVVGPQTWQALFAPQVITEEQLRGCMPHLSPEKRALYLPHLNRALQEWRIVTPKRLAMFLAQLAHESAELRYFEEIASGQAYEGRHDLGNTQPGDGRRYKGRGPIQLTGRANYRRYGQLLGLDLEGHPEQAATPEVGFRIAGAYWQIHGLNPLADMNSVAAFQQVTRRINGGLNGYADRLRYWERAKAAFGLS